MVRQLAVLAAGLFCISFGVSPSVSADGESVDSGVDSDGDFVLDATDNCPVTHNHYQIDLNTNGVGDKCDPAFGGSPHVLTDLTCHENTNVYPKWLDGFQVEEVDVFIQDDYAQVPVLFEPSTSQPTNLALGRTLFIVVENLTCGVPIHIDMPCFTTQIPAIILNDFEGSLLCSHWHAP